MYLTVLTNLPDEEHANKLASSLVHARLAACVNILPPVRSIYRWQEKIETANEIPLLIKTTEERYPELEKFIQAFHPYEVPEIIALPVSTGLASYLQWIASQTQPES